MPRTIFLICIAALLAVSGAWAGDVATFVDLGFSADGGRYMFGQYGVEETTLKPWAEFYIVDVKQNDFVPDGVRKATYPAAPSAGQDGAGGFYKLLSENAALVAKHKIDSLRQGVPLYINLDDEISPDAPMETIEFRHFDTGDSYKVVLSSFVEGTNETLKSSFYLSVERRLKDGTIKRYIVGTPSLKRSGILSYRVRRAFVAPEDGSFIFVVEMRKWSAKGADIRYMVEAFHP